MFDSQQNFDLAKERIYTFLITEIIMMNKESKSLDLKDIISGLSSLSENKELLMEEQQNRNKIHQELAKKYFETINSSVLPF